ncbi:MAG: hypothetical protein AB7S62_17235 [Azoarcus sp.]
MSEYQYYEFAAIDRPLNEKEMAELRTVSTRAVITHGSFVNHYEWGDLKANPKDWMRRYFDAFVYSANWCSCWLALRVPKKIFRKSELEPYVSEYTLAIDASKEHWIFNWSLDESEDYDRFAMDDGTGWMSRLAPLRQELLRGDLRSLYLGWLADAHTMTDDEQEPEVPPGLAALSPAQQALAKFLEVDPDLLAAASTGSAIPSSVDFANIDAWLETWSNDDMKSVLKNIASGNGRDTERQIKSRYAAWVKTQRPRASTTHTRRTVGQLRELAARAASERREREAKARKKREAERCRQREAHLRQMMTKAKSHWKAADTQAKRGVASGYDQAVKILADLAEAYALNSSRAAFERDMERFLAPHSRRQALLRRLAQAKLRGE